MIVTEGNLQRSYKEVARIYTKGSPKDMEEAFSPMSSRIAEFGAATVIKVRKNQNENYEGNVVLFD